MACVEERILVLSLLPIEHLIREEMNRIDGGEDQEEKSKDLLKHMGFVCTGYRNHLGDSNNSRLGCCIGWVYTNMLIIQKSLISIKFHHPLTVRPATFLI